MKWKIMGISVFVILLICCLYVFVSPQKSQAALTKTETTQALEWTLLTATGDSAGIMETGAITVSDSYATSLHIDVALVGVAAHEGTEIIIYGASEAAVDDSWTVITRFTMLSGVTAFKSDITGANTAGSVPVTDPATGNLDHDGKHVFIYDTGTIANSCIGYQIDNSGDAGDTITLLNTPLTTDNACDVYTANGNVQDGSAEAVENRLISIPSSLSQVNVVINNWYDTDGTSNSVVARVRVTKMTVIQ